MIQDHFNNPESALVIIQPHIFIVDVKKAFGNHCHGELIRYFPLLEKTYEQSQFLYGDEEYRTVEGHRIMTNKTIYRYLLCKDTFFAQQQEFRFILSNRLIESPQIFDVKTTAKMQLMSSNEFFNSVHVMA